jgi:choline-sulfatase
LRRVEPPVINVSRVAVTRQADQRSPPQRSAMPHPRQVEMPMRRRLNILLVMADQLTPAALPIHGGPSKTPHVSALAEAGVVFDAAYCNSPLCAPSRVAFMTGQLPSKTGAYDNAAEFRSDIPTFAHYLRLAGYRTVLAGKMHFCGADQLHGFEQRLTTDIYPADFGWTPDWENPHSRPSWYHSMGSVIDAGICVRSNQIDFDEEVVFAAERLIYDHVRGPDDRPLCLVVSLTHPHDPFIIPEQWWRLYRSDDIPLSSTPLEQAELTPHEKRLWRICDMGSATVTEHHLRRARQAYYGAVSYVDDQVGRLLRALQATGLSEDTVVMVTSDHGEMLGGAVSLVDMLPTLVEIGRDGSAGGLASEIDGQSLVPHLTGRGGHDEAFGEYLAEGAIAPIVMIRRGSHKFVASPADPDQLYDLAGDPHERVNLAGSPDHAALRDSFRAEVARRWDVAGLDRAVRESQRRRHLVASALAVGRLSAWDYQPPRDVSHDYIRGHMDLEAREASRRFPLQMPPP